MPLAFIVALSILHGVAKVILGALGGDGCAPIVPVAAEEMHPFVFLATTLYDVLAATI